MLFLSPGRTATPTPTERHTMTAADILTAAIPPLEEVLAKASISVAQFNLWRGDRPPLEELSAEQRAGVAKWLQNPAKVAEVLAAGNG